MNERPAEIAESVRLGLAQRDGNLEALPSARFAPNELRHAFAQVPTGVVAICAEVAGERLIMIASSFVTVSADPPLVAFCAQRISSTWPKLRKAHRLGVNVLGETHAAIAQSMATRTGDRFEKITSYITRNKAGFIEGSAAWFEVGIVEEISAGDHLIVLMHVTHFETTESEPIVYHRRRLHLIAASI